MKLGARIFKTGLAIMLSLYIAIFLGFEPPMIAALAATFAIQPSIYRTFQTIIEQIQANVIGAVIAVIFVLSFGHDPFVVGLVCVLTIALILKIKLEASAIPLAIVTVIIIMETPADNFVEFASIRFILILIGVLSAFIVNLVFIPPRYETKLYHKIVSNTEQITQWIMLLIRKDATRKELIKDLTILNEKMIKLDNLYLLYKEERNYFLKNRYTKARKVVLFRQMLLTSKKALSILKHLERREHEIIQMPESFKEQMEKYLDLLINYHDRILLRYAGKVSSAPQQELVLEMANNKHNLTSSFMSYYQQGHNDEEWMHLLPVISKIIEYQEQLTHLDQLVESFLNYHKADNKVRIDRPDDE